MCWQRKRRSGTPKERKVFGVHWSEFLVPCHSAPRKQREPSGLAVVPWGPVRAAGEVQGSSIMTDDSSKKVLFGTAATSHGSSAIPASLHWTVSRASSCSGIQPRCNSTGVERG